MVHVFNSSTTHRRLFVDHDWWPATSRAFLEHTGAQKSSPNWDYVGLISVIKSCKQKKQSHRPCQRKIAPIISNTKRYGVLLNRSVQYPLRIIDGRERISLIKKGKIPDEAAFVCLDSPEKCWSNHISVGIHEPCPAYVKTLIIAYIFTRFLNDQSSRSTWPLGGVGRSFSTMFLCRKW